MSGLRDFCECKSYLWIESMQWHSMSYWCPGQASHQHRWSDLPAEPCSSALPARLHSCHPTSKPYSHLPAAAAAILDPSKAPWPIELVSPLAQWAHGGTRQMNWLIHTYMNQTNVQINIGLPSIWWDHGAALLTAVLLYLDEDGR